MTRAEIERQWRINGRVIPAMIAATPNILYPSCEVAPGFGRTRYFYRRMAISLAQDSRKPEWFKGQRATFVSLAKMYLESYRKLCAAEMSGTRGARPSGVELNLAEGKAAL